MERSFDPRHRAPPAHDAPLPRSQAVTGADTSAPRQPGLGEAGTTASPPQLDRIQATFGLRAPQTPQEVVAPQGLGGAHPGLGEKPLTDEERVQLTALLHELALEAVHATVAQLLQHEGGGPKPDETQPGGALATLEPAQLALFANALEMTRLTFAFVPQAAVEQAFEPLIERLIETMPATSSSPQSAVHAQAACFDALYQRLRTRFSGTAYRALPQHKGGGESKSWGGVHYLGFHKSQQRAIELLVMRLEGLRELYASLDAQTEGRLLPAQSEHAALDPRRHRLVALALAEVGKVAYGGSNGDSMDTGDVGPDGKSARAGWRRVKAYFEGAGAAMMPDQAFAQTKPVHGISWCAIFAVWAARQAGFETKDWKRAAAESLDETVASDKAAVWQTTHTLKPGDIVNRSVRPDKDAHGNKVPDAGLNHHGIVVAVRGAQGTQIDTVEGNYDGGRVVRKTRDASYWDNHYDPENPNPLAQMKDEHAPGVAKS